jgi:ribosomal protein L18
VSFTNSQARLTVRLAPQTAIAQTVRVVPGATYELTATLTTNSAGRGTLGVRGDDGAILAAQTMGARAGGTLAVTFTVPAHASRVAVYCSASGAASTGLVTADSFTLTRKN